MPKDETNAAGKTINKGISKYLPNKNIILVYLGGYYPPSFKFQFLCLKHLNTREV
jgi:hypothetical protein